MTKPARQRQLLTIGIVARPHGIAGEIKIQLAPEYAAALDILGHVKRIYLDEAEPAYQVVTFRSQRDAAFLKLDRITTRNDAEAVRGARVAIHPRDLAELPKGEYYAHQLTGLRVCRESGELIGELVEVLSTGSNDVYVVNTAKGELLLPALDSVVREIDLAAGVMKVIVPEGLE